MNIASILHEPKSRYSYMYDETTLHLRIKVGKGEAKAISVVGADPFNWVLSKETGIWTYDEESIKETPMIYEGEADYHDVWFCEIKGIDTKRIRYGFVIQTSDGEELLYGVKTVEDLKLHPERRNDCFNHFNFPFLNDEDMYKAPSWSKDTIWYQVTPTCFSDNGEVAADRESGNFKGLTQKLDYIKEMGFTGVYLTPIFEAKSWHLYDTTDYFKVSKALGGNDTFKEFVEKAHSMGIKIMLDAVFNHCGPRHPFWQDVLKNGKNSKYYDCFYILDENKPVLNSLIDEQGDYEEELGYDVNIRSFAYTTYMPKMNTGHPLMREHLLAVAKFWIEEYGIDAWRLDVSNEVSHDFWKAFRKEVKAVNPEVYIMGENWDDSYPWLQGDQFDTVMNYGIMEMIWGLCIPEDTKQFNKITISQYEKGMCNLMTKYPKNVTEHMFNLVASHDLPRLLDICKGDKRRLKLCYALLMTYCGAPCVFYGDEIGMADGSGEPRVPMIWDENKWDKDLQEFMKTLIQLRKDNPSFSAMQLNILKASEEEQVVIIEKVAESQTCYLVLNLNDEAKEIMLPEVLQNRTFYNMIEENEVESKESILVPGFEVFILK